MRFILTLVFSLIATVSLAQQYRVAPEGSDANDCIANPCATLQRAVNLCPTGGRCHINITPGVYSQKTDVLYYKLVSLSGPLDGSGACIDPSAVVVDDNINGTPVAGAIFSVQDHAILTLHCMSLAAYAKGSVGYAARQFAIGDLNNVNFYSFPDGAAITANEASKINVLSPGIYGGAVQWALVSDLSQLTVAGQIVANRPVFDIAFISVIYGSILDFKPSSIKGSITGYSYLCKDAIMRHARRIPGGGAHPGIVRCRRY